MADVPVVVWGLVRDEDNHDVVLLRDERGRMLPIVIGICEAVAILVKLRPEMSAPYMRRPWSHDLIQTLIERRGATLERVVIDGFVNGTFLATLHLQYHGEEVVVDSRPSDAIALLLRMSAPLLVNAEVMDSEAVPPENIDEHDGTDFWDDDEENP